MTEYEKMLDTAELNNVMIYENYDLSETRIKGLYCDNNIALSKDLKTQADKLCVLAEEIGHHKTSYGDILKQDDVKKRKQELKARIWAYSKLLPLNKLISAYKHSCSNRYEIAEHIGITEEFLQESLEYYYNHYGICHSVDGYVIYFKPLCIMKLL